MEEYTLISHIGKLFESLSSIAPPLCQEGFPLLLIKDILFIIKEKLNLVSRIFTH